MHVALHQHAGDPLLPRPSRFRAAIPDLTSGAGPQSSIILGSKKLGEDPSWIGLFHLGWSLRMPVQGHRHGTLQRYRTVAVADTVGLAGIGFTVVASLHCIAGVASHFTRCRSLQALQVISRVAGLGGVVQTCNDATTRCRGPPTAGGWHTSFFGQPGFILLRYMLWVLEFEQGLRLANEVGHLANQAGCPHFHGHGGHRWQLLSLIRVMPGDSYFLATVAVLFFWPSLALGDNR